MWIPNDKSKFVYRDSQRAILSKDVKNTYGTLTKGTAVYFMEDSRCNGYTIMDMFGHEIRGVGFDCIERFLDEDELVQMENL